MNDKRSVWTAARDAETRLMRVTYRLRAQTEHENENVRFMAQYDAMRLLPDVLEHAAMLASLLDDEVVDEYDRSRLLESCAEITGAINAIRKLALASKLEQVEGRTPEEAKAFKRKAAELRARLPHMKGDQEP